jgi:hypothetical protein
VLSFIGSPIHPPPLGALRLYRRGHGRRHGFGLAWRGARGAERRGVLWWPERVEHVGVCFCLCSNACRDHKRANLTKGLVQISSWHLGLDIMCEFQWEMCPSSQDRRVPNRVCRHCSPRDKVDVKSCQIVLAAVQIFPGCS